MKSVELFCASPASTAICSSMDQHSMVRQGGMRPIDRHGHRFGDHHHRHKGRSTPLIPCSSQIPISPRPYFEKTRKSTSSAKQNLEYLRRKSSADISDLSSPSSSSRHLLSDTPLPELLSDSDNSSSALVPSQPLRSIKHHKFDESPVFKPSLSSSYSYDNPVYEFSLSKHSNNDLHAYKSSLSRSNDKLNAQKSSLSSKYDDFHAQKSSLYRLIHDDFHPQKSLLSPTSSPHASKSSLTCTNEGHAYKSPSSPGRPRHQVVELRVSIHCKGCEGKVRKHLSKMEGVTSFSTDLATKKVTVVGNVTPLGVLTSISKVKNAEFWSSSPTSSSSSPGVGMSLVSA